MFGLSFPLRLSLPGLLLLGTLVLLLWGQCAGNSSGPSYSVRVVRTDSLAADFPEAPPILYLTVGLRSEQDKAFRIESLHGNLIFRGLYWSDNDTSQNHDLLVPAHAELRLPMALRLIASLACSPDSLRLLQRALRGGTAHDSTLQLNLGVNAYLSDQAGGHYLQDNGQDFPLPPLQPDASPTASFYERYLHQSTPNE